jgi:hypothetical protein
VLPPITPRNLAFLCAGAYDRSLHPTSPDPDLRQRPGVGWVTAARVGAFADGAGSSVVWVRRGAVGLIGLAIVALLITLVAGTWMVRRSFPTTSGQAVLSGLGGTVEVYRDGYGVPTVVASSTDDLFRAQGYVHAQDRFWEMDMRRHVTAGRVSELFGADTLGTDRFIRTLGWRQVAEAEVELLEADTLAMLEAYADGVNAWTTGKRGSELSLEHALLRVTGAGGYEPEPWTPADSVAWLKAMAWDLRANMEDELLRARLRDVDLGEGRSAEDLFPAFPEDRHPVILPDGGELRDGRFVPGTGDTGPDATDPHAASTVGLDTASARQADLLRTTRRARHWQPLGKLCPTHPPCSVIPATTASVRTRGWSVPSAPRPAPPSWPTTPTSAPPNRRCGTREGCAASRSDRTAPTRSPGSRSRGCPAS